MLCKVTYSQVPEIRRWETLEAGGRGSFFSPSQPSSPDTHHSLSRNLWWPSVAYNQSLILTARMDGAFTMRLVCPQHFSFFSQELESSRAALAHVPSLSSSHCFMCPLSSQAKPLGPLLHTVGTSPPRFAVLVPLRGSFFSAFQNPPPSFLIRLLCLASSSQ